jgi:hypothetical protein
MLHWMGLEHYQAHDKAQPDPAKTGEQKLDIPG